MNLAILGTRGVPPEYGGFETFAAELGTRLVQRGHRVTVYCRSNNRAAQWNGIERIVLPFVSGKYFETISHTALSAIDSLRRDFDAVLLCNAANAFVIPLLRAARIPVAINVDGIERRRRKWNLAGRLVYAMGESFSASFASRVVADANVIADYYEQNFGIHPVTVPYGAEFPNEPDTDILARLNLKPRNYILYVSRFEPENNPLEVVEAIQKTQQPSNPATRQPVNPSTPLVMVGEAKYDKKLEARLKSHAGDQTLFPGAIYGPDYRTLQRNALIYVQATEVGGTHPALIEAMGSGGCVLANDTPENREVGGDSIGYFRLGPRQTLSDAVQLLLRDPDSRERLRVKARQRAAERYSWTAVTDAYERLFEQIA